MSKLLAMLVLVVGADHERGPRSMRNELKKIDNSLVTVAGQHDTAVAKVTGNANFFNRGQLGSRREHVSRLYMPVQYAHPHRACCSGRRRKVERTVRQALYVRAAVDPVC